jgi:hypothetical protein
VLTAQRANHLGCAMSQEWNEVTKLHVSIVIVSWNVRQWMVGASCYSTGAAYRS